ncbi:MAG: hypothetical protein ACXADY_25410 [Candidatus Hodarchaeales archaeon]
MSSESGSFFLANTTEGIILLNEWFYVWNIGTTWNLTIHVFSNSSSAVNITMIRAAMSDGFDWWFSGNFTYQIYPNEIRSEIYVSHVSCDYIPSYNFKCSLADVSENASGTYLFQTIHRGYDVSVGTGCMSVGNITAWLEHPTTEPSSTTNPTTLSSSTSTTVSETESAIASIDSSIVIFSLLTIIVFVRRRRIA